MTMPPEMGTVLLEAFAGFDDLPSPFIAEAQMSALLGQVWAGVEGPRDEAMVYFCTVLADQLRPAGARGRPVLELLARQAPPEVAAQIAEQARRTLGVMPDWVSMLDTVELTRILTATAPLGDQENVLLEFNYRRGDELVDRHILVLLLDYGMGIVKDAFPVDPSATIDQLRDTMLAEPGLHVHDDVGPEDLLESLGPLLTGTDQFPAVDELGEELRDVWHLLISRVRMTMGDASPDALPPRERVQRVDRFVQDPGTQRELAARGLETPDMTRLATAIVDYENDISDGHWDADAVEAFFMGWAVDEQWSGLEVHLGEVLARYLLWSGADGPATHDVMRWHAAFLRE